MSNYAIQFRRNSDSKNWLTVNTTNSLNHARTFVDHENSDYGWIKYRVIAVPEPTNKGN